MNLQRQVNKLNDLIGRELGRNQMGEPIYQWRWSEDLWHQMRAEGYDYKADPQSGIIVARPRYERRKLALHLDHQWVICMWEPPMSEAEWRKVFGSDLEWPHRGEYYPTNVDLDPGVDPSDSLTDAFIRAVREQRSKRLVDHIADSERAQAARERATDSQLDAVIRDSCTAFGNVPGKKAHVSFPNPTASAATEETL